MFKKGKKDNKRLQYFIVFAISFIVLAVSIASGGCRTYDDEVDIAYFFKTEPEKSVIDFLHSIKNHDADYIYSNLLPESDRRNISRERFTRELSEIFSEIRHLEINRIVYLGYENEMSKVVVEFDVEYSDGTIRNYKKYVFLIKENDTWKILFDKTFI
jgi:hypothetical protein